jgi:hypothetical protein
LYETDNYDGTLQIRMPRTSSNAVSTFSVATNPHALPSSHGIVIDAEMHPDDYADSEELELQFSSVRGRTFDAAAYIYRVSGGRNHEQ